jgi:hypothetical protein
MGDGDYMYAFQQVIMPIATEFNPDLVIGMYLSNSFPFLFRFSFMRSDEKW